MQKITLIKNCGNQFDGSMTLKSRDGRYVYANKRFLDFAHAERKDVLGKTDVELFGEEFARPVIDIDRRAWHENHPVEYISDISYLNSQLKIISLKWVVNTGDHSQQLLCTVTDEYDKAPSVRAMAQRIEEIIGIGSSMSFTVQSFKMQKILFDYLSEGIFVVGPTNSVIFINKACERMFGYGPGEAIGLNFEVFIPERFRAMHVKHRDKYIAHPEPRPMGRGMELWAMRKDGEEFPVEISLSPFQDPQGQFVIVFITDITKRQLQDSELRKAYAELEKHSSELAAANEELRDFAYVASHHLQEPMRKLQLYSNMLKKSLKGKLTPKETETLSKLLEFAGMARERINDFQLFTKLNIEEPLKTPVNLNTTIHNVIEELTDLIEDEKANITIANELPTVMGDPALLKQLFYNLISNSLKFCKRDVTPEIAISCKKISKDNGIHKEWLEVDVKDNGVGFDEKFGDKLFRLFQKIRPGTEGTGIGLAVSRKICNLHGGNLTATGKEGEGATFMATLEI